MTFSTSTRLIAAAFAIAASSALAACGGGGSSPIPTPGGGQPTTAPKATLHAGLSEASSGVASIARGSNGYRRLVSAKRIVLDVNLGSTLVPTAVLDVPPSYIPAPYNEPGVQQIFAVAYLVATNGSLIPSPLPSGSWTQSGVSLPTSPFAPGTTFSTISNILPDALTVTTPGTTIGQTTFTDTVVGFGSTSTTADAYPALGLAMVPYTVGDYTNHENYAANGLTFGATGIATPTSSTATADMFGTEAADGTTTIYFPHGAQVLTNTILPTVTTAPSPSTLTTYSIASQTLVADAMTSPVTIEFATAAGSIVKWAPLGFGDNSTNPTTAGLTAGDLTNVYGPYAVSVGGVFAY
jgi:hypothetical protein